MNTDRVAHIAAILKRHVAFKDGPFQRPLIAKVFRRPSSWFGKPIPLRPVAFEARILMTEMGGCVSSFGTMSPYLWLDEAGRLISRTAKGKLVPADITLLTDEDITNLEIGVRGDKKLLDAEYDKVFRKMLHDMLS